MHFYENNKGLLQKHQWFVNVEIVKLMFYQDNGSAHTSCVVAKKLYDIRFKVFPPALYLQDLTTGDYFRFPKHTECLAGQGTT